MSTFDLSEDNVIGGGGFPINGKQPINHTKPLLEFENGEVWLKTGHIETDTTLYPEAQAGIGTGSDLGITRDVMVSTAYVLSATQDICNNGGGTMYTIGQYGEIAQWSYDGESAATFTKILGLAKEVSSPTGICLAGTYLCIVGTNGVHRYNLSGGYVGKIFDLDGSHVAPKTMDYHNSYGFIIAGRINNGEIWRYSTSGAYQGYFSTWNSSQSSNASYGGGSLAPGTNGLAICFVGNIIYATGRANSNSGTNYYCTYNYLGTLIQSASKTTAAIRVVGIASPATNEMWLATNYGAAYVYKSTIVNHTSTSVSLTNSTTTNGGAPSTTASARCIGNKDGKLFYINDSFTNFANRVVQAQERASVNHAWASDRSAVELPDITGTITGMVWVPSKSRWYIGNGNTFYSYNDQFARSGTDLVHTEGGTPADITFDGENFWVITTAGDMYKYNGSDFLYSGTTFSVAAESGTNIRGMEYEPVKGYFWVMNNSTLINVYEQDGTWTEIAYDTEDTVGYGLTYLPEDKLMWQPNSSTGNGYGGYFTGVAAAQWEVIHTSGTVTNSSTSPKSGSPIYVRLK